jgi:thiol:disulfide interchange protein DsbD
MPQSLAEGETPVRASLVAESTAVAPGGTVRVGLLLEQDEGWHTYWRNPGDSGLATEIVWQLPEGWTAGAIVWPVPHRYVEAGDLVTHGYAGNVVLFTDITAPASARGEVTLRAAVEWLMCRDLCIPGSAEVALTLDVGGTGRTASPAVQRDLDASAARLPRSADTVESISLAPYLDIRPVPAGQNLSAAVVIEGLDDPDSAEWVWFPYASDHLFTGRFVSTTDDGKLLLGLDVEVAGSAPTGETLPWGGVLEIQDGETTHFLEYPLPVRIAAEGDLPAATAPEVFATLLGASGDSGLFDQDFADVEGAAAKGGLLYYLLLALVGGVILNVMPCVLPVLSLKVMSFVSHAGEDRGVQVRLGLTFAAGVLASFLALALVVIALQAAGDQLGWGFQFQNPAFVVVMAAIVFAFGLSLFGVFEILLPVQMGGGGKGGAYAESFLNGILATALATPCTAPFLGTALGFAFTQPAWAILAIFVMIAVGLSLPYVLLSLNPAWLRFVPKPGAWMDRFKQGMGFLLMATLVWLLWVLGQQIGLDGLVQVMAFLLVLGFALWLYGSMLNLSSSSTRRSVVWGLVLVLVVGGWWQFLRTPLSSEAIAANTAGATTGHSDGDIVWQPFTVETLEAEVAAGNTVFIDFTAAWCTTCKVNEKTVLSTDAVHEKLRELGVVTLLGDWTNRDPVITRVLRQFGRSGVPFYAVFPAGRLDAPIVLPEIITQGLVLEALEEAGPSRASLSR